MASSSPPHEVFKESGKEKQPFKGQGEDQSLMDLELGLGLGFVGSSHESKSISRSSSSLSQQQQQQQQTLGLGLGLRCDENCYGSFCYGLEAPTSDDDVFLCNYHKGLRWGSNRQILSSNNNVHYDLQGHNYCHLQYMPTPPPPSPWSRSWSIHHDDDCLARPPGLWFTLRSSLNREGKTMFPQIPKAYIRVKDEKLTVCMVKKYLVTKLGLSNQEQVEISCMGEKLVESQSLKQVRDAIWFPRLLEFFNSNPTLFQQYSKEQPTLTYLMPLDYAPTTTTLTN